MMINKDRVEFARQSFAANLRMVERQLVEIREYADRVQNIHHNPTTVGPITRFFLPMLYLWEKRKIVQLLRQARWRIQLYRKVGKGLERGDLSSAIEALSLFAPRKETTRGIVHRLRVGPATIDTIHQIPHILRENMLRLRDELIKIQQTQAC